MIPIGVSGFIHTDDGALVAGQPEVAATWFPVNDHPIDKAAYTFKLAAPEGLEVVANGVLQKSRTRARLDHVDVGRQGTDGVLPGHDGRG